MPQVANDRPWYPARRKGDPHAPEVGSHDVDVTHSEPDDRSDDPRHVECIQTAQEIGDLGRAGQHNGDEEAESGLHEHVPHVPEPLF